MAPVSIWMNPRRRAKRLAIVLFPAPAGPSIAITASRRSLLMRIGGHIPIKLLKRARKQARSTIFKIRAICDGGREIALLMVEEKLLYSWLKLRAEGAFPRS